jgi:predicted Zn-dependent protease
VQVEESDAKNYEEMKGIVEGLLSGNANNITEHEYERWNDLLASTVDGKELPTLSYDASAHPDIVIRLTDEPHQNGRVRAETMLDLDKREIRSTEIVIYNAGGLYRDGEFVAVLQHELGHAIGLGHSNYVGSIMYPSLVIINEEIVGEISGCEAEGVKLAYSTSFEKAECTALVT